MSLKIPETIHDFFMESQIPLTLSDPRLPDEPLILANQPFYRMSGYSAKEALGANCRFMQGKDTQRSSRRLIKEGLSVGRDTKVLIRNYRKSGEAFDNFLYIFTVFDVDNVPLFRVGSQFEVPEIDRSTAVQSHADQLSAAMVTVSRHNDFAHHQSVKACELASVAVKSLLMARLLAMRDN